MQGECRACIVTSNGIQLNYIVYASSVGGQMHILYSTEFCFDSSCASILPGQLHTVACIFPPPF